MQAKGSPKDADVGRSQQAHRKSDRLLAYEEWELARGLAPVEGGFGGSHWHEILFARAYSKTGNLDLAREWWNKALVADPQNGEARAAADNQWGTAMVTRAEVVQTFVNLYSDPSYLEIGVSLGLTFHAVKANRKIAVDPKFQFPPGEREVRGMTSYHEVPSDIYFGELVPPNAKFDVIFLDGLHTLEQTLRDLLNAVSLLSPYGVIVIDDVIPNSYQASLRDLDNFSEVRRISGLKDRSWMGDVFRLVFFIDTFLQQFSYATVLENHGQLVLWAARRKAGELQPRNLEHICRYEYCDVLRNKSVFKLRPLSEIRQLVQGLGQKKN
jgi:tetratricopeptide (TPR) repeat protein